MNIVCRLCRSWMLRRRIHAQMPRLQRVAFAWSHDPELARSLAAAAARAAAGAFQLLRDDKELRVTLYRHMVCAYLGRSEGHADVLAFPSPGRIGGQAPLAYKVRAALQGLDEQQRLIVALIDLGGCSYDEAARVLGIPRAGLLQALCNARVHLKVQLLGGLSSDQPHGWRALP